MKGLYAPSRFLATVAIASGLSVQAGAQVLKKNLDEITDVGVEEHRGETIPMDVEFTDASGRTVTTGDWFDGERPVILVPAYYDCPLLCTLVLNRVQESLNRLDWTAGEDFRVVTFSFDFPTTTEMARQKQELYLLGYNRDAGEDGWTFHTGSTESIRALCGAIGYRYKFLPERAEFSHPAALVFLTPEGVINNYMEKLEYPHRDVKLALTEAAEGKIGTIFDRVAHFCFYWDPKTGQYSLRVFNIMRVGAMGGAVLLATFIAIQVALKRRKERGLRAGAGPSKPPRGAENGHQLA